MFAVWLWDYVCIGISVQVCDFVASAEPFYFGIQEAKDLLLVFHLRSVGVLSPFDKLAEVKGAIVEYWAIEIKSDYIYLKIN